MARSIPARDPLPTGAAERANWPAKTFKGAKVDRIEDILGTFASLGQAQHPDTIPDSAFSRSIFSSQQMQMQN